MIGRRLRINVSLIKPLYDLWLKRAITAALCLVRSPSVKVTYSWNQSPFLIAPCSSDESWLFNQILVQNYSSMNSNTLVNCFAAEFRIYIIVILPLPSDKNKRPMGHIAHLRNQFKSMNTFEPSNDNIRGVIKKFADWRYKFKTPVRYIRENLNIA